MRDAQGKVTHRIVEASCHIVLGANVTAKPTRVVSAVVQMDVAPDMKAIPKELEGVTIVLKGEGALELLSRIAQAIKAIQDPNLAPEERRILIETIRAFDVKPKEGGE